jgi:hypothetical protein
MSKRDFNVAGPCVLGRHYILDPLRGIGDELTDLVDSGHYFVIHAARQSGKTTLLQELVRQINARGEHYALYCSLETVQETADSEKGIPEIIQKIKSCIEECGLPNGFANDVNYEYSGFASVLNSSLVCYCRSLDKPLTLFFDETDCLTDGTLISFLRQLRMGYISRDTVPFVHTVALAGKSRLCDYKVSIRPNSEAVIITDAFNISAGSFSLRDFTKTEITELYAQHTSETGQVFESQSVDLVFDLTQGQPWLVNAIARECVEAITKNDYTIPITREMAETAINALKSKNPKQIDDLMGRNKQKWD